MNLKIMIMKYIGLVLVLLINSVADIMAQGHGPIFGLATPTLGKGHKSFNVGAMSLATEEQRSLMLRYFWSYGVTEDLQLNLTTPTVINKIDNPPRTRGNNMMPANGDIEASMFYRFHSNAFGVGKRFETTAMVAGSVPTEKERGGINVGNAIHTALVTGYASRTTYFWLGGGYQYYFERNNEQIGDLLYASAVFGYRPNIFKRDYPKPDWRIFIESLAEFPGRSKGADEIEPWEQQRGQKFLIGPSFLGLYGAWGIIGGVLLPVYQQAADDFQKEKYRLVINLSYWF